VLPYQNAFKGQSCYLIADGVSLKWFDLNAFTDKHVISCGFLPFHSEFHQLNVEYALMVETWWFYPFQRLTDDSGCYIRNRLQQGYRKVIDQYPEVTFFLNLSNYPVLRRPNIRYLFQGYPEDELSNSFQQRGESVLQGTLRASISFAAYLGFEHCYLVGYDYTHVPSRSLHWYEKSEGVFVEQKNYETSFFNAAKEFIDITTITLDGTSELLPSVTYESFTGEKPFYRENDELVKPEFLNYLASWPGYAIY
jgi:hypothetical protein